MPAAVQQAPPAIDVDQVVFSIDTHPTQSLLALGTIQGTVACYRYGEESNTMVHEWNHHEDSCRALAFTPDGSKLLTVSVDKSLQVIDMGKGKLSLRKKQAHRDGVNAVAALSHDLAMTGDDEGQVRLWDLRQKTRVREWKEHGDYIANMTYVADKRTMLVASGDGCLSVLDFRKDKPLAVCENQDEELLSVAVVKNGRKAVVGTQDGVLSLFSWGDWGDCTDRYPGHPASIDAMCKIDDSTICTGSGDGVVRVLSILPNRCLGVIGSHKGYPIECMALDHESRWIASCSHDGTVRFWSPETAQVEEEEEEGTESDDEGESSDPQEDHSSHNTNSDSDSDSSASTKKPAAKRRRVKAKTSMRYHMQDQTKKSFFAGIE